MFFGHLRFELGNKKNSNGTKFKFKMATIVKDETGSEEEREIRVSRLSTTSVVCGPRTMVLLTSPDGMKGCQ